MASDPRISAAHVPAMEPESAKLVEVQAIDGSSRVPVLFFSVMGALWLLVATALEFIASYKLHTPAFLANCEWLTYGRVEQGALNAFVYGWASNAIFGIAIWIMARLSRTELRLPGILVVSGLFWNLGVTLGIAGILLGHSTSVTWLEMPAFATPLLFFAYILIGTWGFLTFSFRREENVFVSQWYILAAFFWFPSIYAVGQVMAVYFPARGTVQSIVAAWYSHNVLALWLAPVALAAIYYFLPKLLGKAIHHYSSAGLGFWTYAFIASWASMSSLIGSPVPAWVQTTGISGSFLMVVPLVAITINIFGTLSGSWSGVRGSVSLPFVVFGAVSFVLSGIVGILLAIPSISELLQFTYFISGYETHCLYAFFSMVAFGALYYIVPRLVGREWPAAGMITIHFWSSALGVALAVISLFAAGITQGGLLNTADENNQVASFIQIIEAMDGFLWMRTAAWVLLAVGHVAFAINLVRLVSAAAVAGQQVVYRAPSKMEASR